MSLTKLSVTGNNLLIPGHEKTKTFFTGSGCVLNLHRTTKEAPSACSCSNILMKKSPSILPLGCFLYLFLPSFKVKMRRSLHCQTDIGSCYFLCNESKCCQSDQFFCQIDLVTLGSSRCIASRPCVHNSQHQTGLTSDS